MSEHLNTDVVRLENQADSNCPYHMKSLWRFADGDLNALVYDISLQIVCLEDSCSVANCGQRAKCVSEGNSTGCQCEEGFFGNPYERCYPVDYSDDCGCHRLIFSTQNSVALSKHHNSYGEYFLYGEFEGSPVYQHFAGVEYLYQRDGNWLISDQIGLREAGLQNQGDISNCPYRFRTTWEYADIEQPGWQWVYDYTAKLVCPSDFCSVTKCGFHATCYEERSSGVCKCDEGFAGNPYIRCFPLKDPSIECDCKELTLSSIGASALAQADKMGSYYLYDIYQGRPAYQHKSGLDFLFFAEGNAWVIGAKFGGSRVGVVNFDRGQCPYNLTSHWRHSVGGKLQVDESLGLSCSNQLYDFSPRDPNDFIGTSTQRPATAATPSNLQNSPSDLSQAPSIVEKVTVSKPEATVTTPSTTGVSFQTRPPPQQSSIDSVNVTTVAPEINKVVLYSSTDSSSTERTTSITEPTAAEAGTTTTLATTLSTTTTAPTTTTEAPTLDTTCTCREIYINSTNRPTVTKHGAQLGKYILHSAKSGRPVYKHHLRDQYLYYHPYSGGNWLINSEVGLLYGGIQNSKDYPICPYLINTVWQYGDSELGGWVYDPTLKVTCPEDTCSRLKCGFRAQCIDNEDGEEGYCACRPGFEGDPKVRCYPIEIKPKCPCLQLALNSPGPSKDHQRDKMGEYFLWGYYNNKPVYQHSSGLDFLYFHKNNVWGIGPKIGGNSAGLLNFGTLQCPYSLKTPWEFGTKDKSLRRQVDRSLQLICADPPKEEIPVERTAQSTLLNRGRLPPPPPLPPHFSHNPNPFKPPLSHSSPHPVYRPPPPTFQDPPRRTSPFSLPQSTIQCGLRSILPEPSNLLKPQGNKAVRHGSFPWQADITILQREDDLEHLCSGVIVSEKYVLTVASCLTGHPMLKYRIILGQHSLEEKEGTEEQRTIQSIYIHDHYDDLAGDNDIALVKLKEPLIFHDHIRPVCLPERDNVVSSPSLCELSSWMDPKDDPLLQASAVPIVQDPCFRDSLTHHDRSKICSGSFQNALDCALDPGTPLVCSIGDRATVSGLMSRKPNCTASPTGSSELTSPLSHVFVRVSQYSEWIKMRLSL